MSEEYGNYVNDSSSEDESVEQEATGADNYIVDSSGDASEESLEQEEEDAPGYIMEGGASTSASEDQGYDDAGGYIDQYSESGSAEEQPVRRKRGNTTADDYLDAGDYVTGARDSSGEAAEKEKKKKKKKKKKKDRSDSESDSESDSGDGIQQQSTLYGSMVKDDVKKVQREKEMDLEDFFAKFYWNSSFQKLMEKPSLTPEQARSRKTSINNLLESFVNFAKPIVKTIVRERNVELESRTIPPLDVGGVAGGLKFIQSNFFFKFACDEGAISLYGGEHQAQKAATHELRSLNAILGCGGADLFVPLMAVCTYLGWRVIVVSKLPIGADSLVYGSADAGRTIYSDKTFHKLIGRCADKLKLKEHGAVDDAGKLHHLYGPVDLEGHLGLDNRYYVIDAARLFCPAQPVKGLGPSVLYRMLRPEFQQDRGPLSSDCFTGFGMHDRKVHNKQAREATRHLESVVIPAFAEVVTVARLADVKQALHSEGINMRYAGMVLALVRDPECRQVILTEMLARGFRNELFAHLRQVSTNDHHAAVVEYCSKFRRTFAPIAVLRKYFFFCRDPALVDNLIAVTLAGTPVVDMRTVISRGLFLAGVETDLAAGDEIVVKRIRVIVKRLTVSEEDPLSFEEKVTFFNDAYKQRSSVGLDGVEQVIHLAHLYLSRPECLDQAKATFERALQETTAKRGPDSAEVAQVKLIQSLGLMHSDFSTARSLLGQVRKAQTALRADTKTADVAAFNLALLARDLDAAAPLADKFSLQTVRDPVVVHNTLKMRFLNGDEAVKPQQFRQLSLEFGKRSSARATCLKSEAEVMLQRGAAEAALDVLQEVRALEIDCLGEASFPLAETLALMGRCGAVAQFDAAIDMAKQLCGGSVDSRAGFVLWHTLGEEEQLAALLGSAPTQGEHYLGGVSSLIFHQPDDLAFQLHALSPQLKKLLEDSGVSHHELLDPEKATVIFTQLLKKFATFDAIASASVRATKEFTAELREQLDKKRMSSIANQRWHIVSHSDTVDRWAELDVENWQDKADHQVVMIGHLRRWVSRGVDVSDKQLLLVRVGGRMAEGGMYWFHAYDPAELDEVAAAGETLIYQTHSLSSKYSRAEWILKEAKLVGIRMSTKLRCDEHPSITEVFFDRAPLARRKVVVVRKGGIIEKRHKKPIPLPGITSNIPDDRMPNYDEVDFPPARDDFPTIDTVSASGEGIQLTMPDPMAFNEELRFRGFDSGRFRISLVNTDKKHFFTGLQIHYKKLNADEWLPCGNVEYESNPFPLVSDTGTQSVYVRVKFPYFDGSNVRAMHGFSHNARFSPWRVRFTFVSKSGGTVSRIFERAVEKVHLAYNYQQYDEVVSLDAPDLAVRVAVNVDNQESKWTNSNPIIVSNHGQLYPEDARRLVKRAAFEGVSEIRLPWSPGDGNTKLPIRRKFYALIDHNAHLVYAIKVHLYHGKHRYGKQAYIPVPFYGDEDAVTIAGTSAVENKRLPRDVKEGIEFLARNAFDVVDQGKDDVEVKPKAKQEEKQEEGEREEEKEEKEDAAAGAVEGGSSEKNLSYDIDLSALTDTLARTNAAIEQYVRMELETLDVPEASSASPADKEVIERINKAIVALAQK